jgi:Flp pilus assembly protein TadG
MRGLGRLRRDDRGVSSLELAFIAPSLILLIFLIVQIALDYYGRSVALQAAREAVSQLRLQQTPDLCSQSQQSVKDYAKNYAADVGGSFVRDFRVTGVTCDPDEVTVTVQATAVSLTGFQFHINETVSGRVEHFQGST